MMIYPEFSDSQYTALCNNLVDEKGSDLQREFLEAARESGTFVEWMDQRVEVEKDAEAQPFDLWVGKLCENEYKEPPKQIEKAMFDKWSALTRTQASQGSFWGYVTLAHVKKGLIEACYLAANGGNSPTGLERIDRALSDSAKPKEIDSTVRTILRRLGGLPKRGRRSVYVDCTFARIWWRNHVAGEVCDASGADLERVLKTLPYSKGHQGYWEELISLVVSKNSVLGDSRVRTALIWALSELVDDEDKQQLFKKDAILKIILQIGIRCAWQELGVFEVGELKQIMEQDFLGQIA